MYVFACLLIFTALGCLRDEYPERLGSSFPDSGIVPERKGDLRVVTYNLYCWNACPKGYKYVKAWLEEVLPTTDVIAFQEFECSCWGNIKGWLTSTSFGGKKFKSVKRSGHGIDMYVDTTTTVETSDLDRIGSDRYGGRYVSTATVELTNGHTLKVANHHGCLGSTDSGCRGGGKDAIFEELEAHDFFEGDTSIWFCDCNDMQHYMDEFCDYGFEYQKTKSGSLAGFDNIAWSAHGLTYMQAFQYDGRGNDGASDHQGLVIDLKYGSDPCSSSCASCVEGSETICASCPEGKALVDGVCTEGLCQEQNWPDLDHNLVCGDCKVLVDNFQASYEYGTCSHYCENVGRECVGAWDESNDSCSELSTMTCDQTLASSDAICECGDLLSSQEPVDPKSTETPGENLCAEEQWPDLDHGLVCGDCKVLVHNFQSTYGTCSGYCEAIGLTCKGGWEEVNDTCEESFSLGCFDTLSSSDAICECNPPSATNPPVTDPPVDPGCGAEVPEDCKSHINWAQDVGRQNNPSWYSSFEQVTGVPLEDSTTEDMTVYFACTDTGHQECADIELPCGRSCGN